MTSILKDFLKNLDSIQPRTILDVLPVELIKLLMQGFSLTEQAGIVLIYDNNEHPGKLYRLDPFDSDDPRQQDNYNPFCAFYRSSPEQNELCEKCDLQRARNVLNGKHPDLSHYICHMGLIDISCGLKVGDKIRGVLFAGQLISEDASKKSSMGSIYRSIKNRARPDQHEQLKELVQKNVVPSKQVDNRIETFSAITSGIQQIVNRLYATRHKIATESSVNLISQYLATPVENTPSKMWWDVVEHVITDLQTVIGGASIIVLTRRNSRYVVKATSPDRSDVKNRPLPVIHLISWPQDEVKSIHDQDKLRTALKDRFKLDMAEGFLYRLDLSVRVELGLSTVIIIDGTVPTHIHEFVQSCCHIIANQSFSVNLLSALKVQQEHFAQQVAFTGHWLKTPIQAIFFALRELKKLRIEEKLVADRRDSLIEKADRQVRMAWFDAQLLQTKQEEPWEAFDIMILIKELIGDFQFQANELKMTIRLDDQIVGRRFIRANRSKIHIALSNLLDNAIKYSYEGKYVGINCVQSSQAQIIISISNYGIGFSKKDREYIFELGARAEVYDPYRTRGGGGLGLTQALQNIESCGGTLDIESNPADTGPRGDRRRYVTVVYVSFPTVSV